MFPFFLSFNILRGGFEQLSTCSTAFWIPLIRSRRRTFEELKPKFSIYFRKIKFVRILCITYLRQWFFFVPIQQIQTTLETKVKHILSTVIPMIYTLLQELYALEAFITHAISVYVQNPFTKLLARRLLHSLSSIHYHNVWTTSFFLYLGCRSITTIYDATVRATGCEKGILLICKLMQRF